MEPHELSSDDIVEIHPSPRQNPPNPKVKAQRTITAFFPIMDESGQCATNASPPANLSRPERVIPLAPRPRTPKQKRKVLR